MLLEEGKMDELDHAAEKLSERMKKIDSDSPLLKKLDAAPFLAAKGFNIGTLAGCKGALQWLDEARVEDAFWENDGPIDNAVDWYIGEGRIEALRKYVLNRLEELKEDVHIFGGIS